MVEDSIGSQEEKRRVGMVYEIKRGMFEFTDWRRVGFAKGEEVDSLGGCFWSVVVLPIHYS